MKILKLSQRGSFLIEALVGVALIAVLAVAAMQIYSLQKNMTSNTLIALTRNELTARLNEIIRSRTALLRTAAHSTNLGTALGACVWGALGATACNATNPDAPVPIQLFHGDGNPNPVAGVANAETFYDKNGNRCTVPSPSCMFRARSFFVATCAVGTTCKEAHSLKVSFELTKISNSEGSDLQFSQGFYTIRLPIQTTPSGFWANGFIPVYVGKKLFAGSPFYQNLPQQHIDFGQNPAADTLNLMGNLTVQGSITLNGPNALFNFESTGTINTPRLEVGVAGSGDTGLFAGLINIQNSIVATDAYSTMFYVSSDRRLKKMISPIEDVENRVLQLQGWTFRWKDTNTPDLGLMAQEVEKIFPEAVVTDSGGKKFVQYANLIAALVESYKSSKQSNQRRIEQNRFRIEKLKLAVQKMEQGQVRLLSSEGLSK